MYSKAAPFFLRHLGAVLLCFMLISCGGNSYKDIERHVLEPTSPYERTIYLSAADDSIKNTLLKKNSEYNRILFLNEANGSEFTLNITAEAKNIQTQETKPRLFGKLYTTTVPVEYTLNYRLTRGLLSVTNGHVTEILESQHSVFPKLETTLLLTQEQEKKFIQKMMLDVLTHIHKEPWQGTISGQKDPLHVKIIAAPHHGFTTGDRFTVKGTPSAILELSTFEKNNAILRLVSGALPTTGRTIIPLP